MADETHAPQDDIDADQGAQPADEHGGYGTVAEEFILKRGKQSVHGGQDSLSAVAGWVPLLFRLS